MKTIEIAIDSPAGRAVCNLADSLGLDPQDVFQGILFGICNSKKAQSIMSKLQPGTAHVYIRGISQTPQTDMLNQREDGIAQLIDSTPKVDYPPLSVNVR